MNRRAGRHVALVLLFGTVAACASISVRVGRDPRVDFDRYRTYAWTPESRAQNAGVAAVLDAEIKSGVAKEISEKGLTEVPVAKADILASYSAITGQEQVYGDDPGPWSWGSTEEVYSTRAGSLTLEFRDARTHRSIWQGTALGVMGDDDASPERVARAIEQLIVRYPEA